MRCLALAAGLAIAAAVPSALANDGSADDVLIAAFEAGACQLTTDMLDEAFHDAGLDQKDRIEAIASFVNRGEIAFSADGQLAYLTAGAVCAGFAVPEIDADPDTLVAVVALFEDNGCALPMTAASFNPLRADFSDASIDAALASLIADRALTFENRVSTLTVGAVCGTETR